MKNLLTEQQGNTSRPRLDWMKEAFLGLFTTRMSAVAFHLDYAVFPPVILWCLYVALQRLGVVPVLALVAAGLAAWTLAEYVLHRYALHHLPYFSARHLEHHEQPRAMIASPTLFTLSFFMLSFLWPLWSVIGAPMAQACFAGFLAGYLAFAAVHEAVHHSEWQGPVMRYFKRLHAIHHHGQSDKNFGVITDVWDRVFGTYSNEMRRPGPR